MKRRLTILLTILAFVFGGILLSHLVKALFIKYLFAHYVPPAVSVSTVKAESKNWQPHIQAVGNFSARNGVEVNSQAAGSVVKIHFDSGQYIEKNAPLIDIDDSVEQALLKFNQAQLVLKDISFKRQDDLFKRGAAPISNVDEAKANLEQAQANVEKIQAEIQQKHIVAPFAGQLGIRQVNLGQYITPGQTSIVTLQSMDPLFLEFYLPEQLHKKIHLHQRVEFNIEEFPNLIFYGEITAINAKVDSNTHNLLIQATLPNCPAEALKSPLQSHLVKAEKKPEDQRIFVQCNTQLNQQNQVKHFAFIPGMFSAISVEQPVIPNVIVLPSTAISYSLYGNSVFVLEPNKDGKKDDAGRDTYNVKRIFVSTGEQQGNYTIIEKGINPGQMVVSSGELKLENGTRVVINNSVPLNNNTSFDNLNQ